jgi:hypothetical protein
MRLSDKQVQQYLDDAPWLPRRRSCWADAA